MNRFPGWVVRAFGLGARLLHAIGEQRDTRRHRLRPRAGGLVLFGLSSGAGGKPPRRASWWRAERQRRIEGGCPVGGIASVAGAVPAGGTEVVPLRAAFLPIRPRLRGRNGSCAPPGGISSDSTAVTAA